MAHAQKPDFVFRRNGRVHLNRRGRQFRRLVSRGVRNSGSNAGYTMFRGTVKGTGYPVRQFPLHFPPRVSPCAITFQQDSNTFCGEYFEAFWRVSERSIRILVCVYATRQAMYA